MADIARAAGIALMVHYIPLHHQPVLAPAVRGSDLSGADALYPRLLSLPCTPAMTTEDQTRVLDVLRSMGP